MPDRRTEKSGVSSSALWTPGVHRESSEVEGESDFPYLIGHDSRARAVEEKLVAEIGGSYEPQYPTQIMSGSNDPRVAARQQELAELRRGRETVT